MTTLNTAGLWAHMKTYFRLQRCSIFKFQQDKNKSAVFKYLFPKYTTYNKTFNKRNFKKNIVLNIIIHKNAIHWRGDFHNNKQITVYNNMAVHYSNLII